MKQMKERCYHTLSMNTNLVFKNKNHLNVLTIQVRTNCTLNTCKYALLKNDKLLRDYRWKYYHKHEKFIRLLVCQGNIVRGIK